MRLDDVREAFLLRFYADQARTPVIKAKLNQVVATMPTDGLGLNIGSSTGARIDERVKNVDIRPGPEVDYVADVTEGLPFDDDSIDLIITQEVLEHLPDPRATVREMTRVLRPGGTLYLQVPFTIGYHPGPHDFWRFSREGIVTLAKSGGLALEETGRSVGPATGFYRIAVEFWATLLGGRSRRLTG